LIFRPANQLLNDESGRKSNESQTHFNQNFPFENHFQTFSQFQTATGKIGKFDYGLTGKNSERNKVF